MLLGRTSTSKSTVIALVVRELFFFDVKMGGAKIFDVFINFTLALNAREH